MRIMTHIIFLKSMEKCFSYEGETICRATLKEGLKRIARKVWMNITQEYLASFYESMPRQMQAVVDAQGGHTKN